MYLSLLSASPNQLSNQLESTTASTLINGPGDWNKVSYLPLILGISFIARHEMSHNS